MLGHGLCLNGVHLVGVISKPSDLTTAGSAVVFEIFVLHSKAHSRAKRLSAAQRVVLIWCGTYYGVIQVDIVLGCENVNNQQRLTLPGQFKTNPISPLLPKGN